MRVNSCARREFQFRLPWFWLGLAAVFLTIIPCALLGQDAIFTYHDQLDGELIAYLLQARHLFQGNLLPEFMGGVSKTALTLPAPLCVLLFLGGDGYAGLSILQLVGQLCGYAGMYLLCRETVEESWIAAVAGGLYALIPFLPVYGLSQFGIPLLFWCVLQLREGKHTVGAYLYVALYALCSSLVLVGFGLLGAGILVLLWEAFGDRPQKGGHVRGRGALLRLLSAWLLMLGLYVSENARLLWELLGGGATSHKAEYALNASPFFDTFAGNLLRGGQHSQDDHLWIAAVTVLTAAMWLPKRAGKRNSRLGKREMRLLQTIVFCMCGTLFLALFAALWDAAPGIAVRRSIDVLGAFQLNRLLWMAPCLWYLMGACGIALAWRLFWESKKLVLRWGCVLLMAAAIGITGIQLLSGGDVKSNVQKLRNPDYGLLSFSDYYAIGVMDQVEEFLNRETGRSKDTYRVVSLGIDPAAALYHGFYCLDGYSNNYPLEYKHAFRCILSPELDKSEYLREYFDAWGNRCYLFSAEVPGYYTIEKNGFFFQEYELNTDALREMGGRYLLSAAYIRNAEEQGLTLLREEPFETEDSYYRIFVYGVNGN